MATINEEVLLKPIRTQVDRIMIITLGALLFISIGIGWFYDALLMAFLISMPAFVVPLLIWRVAAGSFLLRLAIATALVFNVAIHIQASHGLIEMHFGVFAILAFLLAYRDWRVIVYGAALVAVHHVVLNFLQAANYNVWVFRNGADFGIVILHAAFVVFESVILVFLCLQFKKELMHLATLAEIAERIADGDLSQKVIGEDEDFVSVLLHSMERIQNSLNNFMVAQKNLAERHAQGFISERIDTTQLSGVYGEIATEINNLVDTHIAVKMQVVDVITRYSKGDFSVDMEKLPNEKAQITDAVDNVKKTLLAISDEINVLVNAVAAGDFSKRGNAQKFDYVFKDMINALNTLIETCGGGFRDIERLSNALAQGDLTQVIEKHYPGTFGKVTNGMNSTAENLKSLINEIKDSVDTIGMASREISAGNNDLSHRTEEQASSIEETAASMHELTSTVEHNSKNARQANELAVGATEIANKGVAVVQDVVRTMENINESSLRIVDIISVIDDIAFQTNILALNAAVEAARAGEQGKGFAVVATEVRDLAQRAANAAGEIKHLIGDSVERVAGGSRQVADAGQTMQDIVQAIRNVTTIISKIAGASAEQSSGIAQIGQAISSIDEVTQQNAALVEQVAATAESLESQTGHLATEMAHFRTETNQ